MVQVCPHCEATFICDACRSGPYMICPVCRMEFQIIQDRTLDESMELLNRRAAVGYQAKLGKAPRPAVAK